MLVLAGLFLAATRVRIEKTRSASETERVASALSLRPVNGKSSGPRWHWELMFTRHTWFTKTSINWAISLESFPKIDACCPYFDSTT